MSKSTREMILDALRQVKGIETILKKLLDKERESENGKETSGI